MLVRRIPRVSHRGVAGSRTLPSLVGHSADDLLASRMTAVFVLRMHVEDDVGQQVAKKVFLSFCRCLLEPPS